MSQKLSWIDRARKLAAYHGEAADFVRRVGQQLPTSPDDARAVAKLWLEAELLDETICARLAEMNDGLLDGKAELDVTRGASIRPVSLGQMLDAGQERDVLFYECSWSLTWGQGRGVALNLGIDSPTATYDAAVLGLSAGLMRRIRYPIIEAELEDALADAYAAEATT